MKFLTVDQAAERLQCSDWTVKQMIAKRKLHAVRLGGGDNGDWRISEAALIEFGVGGPRPIVLSGGFGDVVGAFEAVADVAETVATEVYPGLPKSRTIKRLRGGPKDV